MQDRSSSITFAVKLLQKLLYKASVKTFVKHRPISCSKERKPRNEILLTSVWDVTKTRNGDRRTSTENGKLKKWEQGRELEIKSLFPFFIFPFPILFPRSPFPVPRSPFPVISASVKSVDTVRTKPRCSPTIYGPCFAWVLCTTT